MGFIERIAEAMRPASAEPQSTENAISKAIGTATEAAGTDDTDQTATEAAETNGTGTSTTQNQNIGDTDQDDSVSPEGEKSYSQGELDSILEERKKEWEKERLYDISSLSKDSQIEELKRELLKRDLKEKVIARLEEAKLPVGAAELVQYTDEAGTMENLEKVIATVGQLVQEGVMNRLKGRTPEGIGRAADTNGYKDPFTKAFVDAMKK